MSDPFCVEGHDYRPYIATGNLFCPRCGIIKIINYGSENTTEESSDVSTINAGSGSLYPDSTAEDSENTPVKSKLRLSSSNDLSTLEAWIQTNYEEVKANAFETQWMAEWTLLTKDAALLTADELLQLRSMYIHRDQKRLLTGGSSSDAEVLSYRAFLDFVIRPNGLLPADLNLTYLKSCQSWKKLSAALVRRNGVSWSDKVEAIKERKLRNVKQRITRQKNMSSARKMKPKFKGSNNLGVVTGMGVPQLQALMMQVLSDNESSRALNVRSPLSSLGQVDQKIQTKVW